MHLCPALPQHSTARPELLRLFCEDWNPERAAEITDLPLPYVRHVLGHSSRHSRLTQLLGSHYPHGVHRKKISNEELSLVADFLCEVCPPKRSDLKSLSSPHLQYETDEEIYRQYTEAYPLLMQKLQQAVQRLPPFHKAASLSHALGSLEADGAWIEIRADLIEDPHGSLYSFFQHNILGEYRDSVWSLIREYMGTPFRPRCRATVESVKDELVIQQVSRCFLGTRCPVSGTCVNFCVLASDQSLILDFCFSLL